MGEDTYDIIIRNRTVEEEEAGKNRDKTVDDLREVHIPSASGTCTGWKISPPSIMAAGVPVSPV